MALRLRSLAFPLSSATRRRCAPRAVACASLAGRRVVSTSVEVSSSPKSPSSTLPLDEPPSLPTPPHPSIPSPQLPYSQPGPSDAVGLSADGAVAVVEPVSGVRLPGPSSSSPSSSPPLPHPPAQPSRTSDPIRSTSRSAEMLSPSDEPSSVSGPSSVGRPPTGERVGDVSARPTRSAAEQPDEHNDDDEDDHWFDALESERTSSKMVTPATDRHPTSDMIWPAFGGLEPTPPQGPSRTSSGPPRMAPPAPPSRPSAPRLPSRPPSSPQSPFSPPSASFPPPRSRSTPMAGPSRLVLPISDPQKPISSGASRSPGPRPGSRPVQFVVRHSSASEAVAERSRPSAPRPHRRALIEGVVALLGLSPTFSAFDATNGLEVWVPERDASRWTAIDGIEYFGERLSVDSVGSKPPSRAEVSAEPSAPPPALSPLFSSAPPPSQALADPPPRSSPPLSDRGSPRPLSLPPPPSSAPSSIPSSLATPTATPSASALGASLSLAPPQPPNAIKRKGSPITTVEAFCVWLIVSYGPGLPATKALTGQLKRIRVRAHLGRPLKVVRHQLAGVVLIAVDPADESVWLDHGSPPASSSTTPQVLIRPATKAETKKWLLEPSQPSARPPLPSLSQSPPVRSKTTQPSPSSPFTRAPDLSIVPPAPAPASVISRSKPSSWGTRSLLPATHLVHKPDMQSSFSADDAIIRLRQRTRLGHAVPVSTLEQVLRTLRIPYKHYGKSDPAADTYLHVRCRQEEAEKFLALDQMTLENGTLSVVRKPIVWKDFTPDMVLLVSNIPLSVEHAETEAFFAQAGVRCKVIRREAIRDGIAQLAVVVPLHEREAMLRLSGKGAVGELAIHVEDYYRDPGFMLRRAREFLAGLPTNP